MKNKPLRSPPPVPPATRAQVDKFLRGLHAFRAKGDRPFDEAEITEYDEAGAKVYLDRMTVGLQQGVARRIMMDILKSPAAKRRREPEAKRKPAKTRKTKAKSKRPSKKRPSKKKRSPAKKNKAGRRR